MIPCAACSRFIRSDAHRCPFCETVLRDAPSPVRPAITGVLLGLALAACGGKATGDEGAGSETTVGPVTTTEGPDTTTVGPVTTTMEATSSTMSSVGDTDGEAAVTAYGGPDVDTSPPEEETAGGTTVGDTTSTGTDTGGSSGTAGSSGTVGSSGQ